jgi:hypothetical protein
MFHYKSISFYKNGLDTEIYNKLKNTKPKKDYYFYIFNYVYPINKQNNMMPNDFYTSNNNSFNTWNYDLKYESTTKINILEDNIKFDFGNYKYTIDDEYILVKANGHINTSQTFGQAHIVLREKFENNYDKNKYIGQKILRTNNSINEELNVFVVRNLDTRELNFFCILCVNDTSVNINRKKSKCNFFFSDISILGDKLNNFIDYVNHIKFDYGRIELLKDHLLGWCIIDVNNSPGGGPITDLAKNKITELFIKVI